MSGHSHKSIFLSAANKPLEPELRLASNALGSCKSRPSTASPTEIYDLRQVMELPLVSVSSSIR